MRFRRSMLMSGRGRGGIRAVRPYHVALFFRCRDEDVSISSIYVSYAVHRVAVISHVILVWSVLGLLARSLGAFTLVGVRCLGVYVLVHVGSGQERRVCKDNSTSPSRSWTE